ncbi:MAG: tRNA lysidine(34) synthetase TilS [Rickettsiales bacterium]
MSRITQVVADALGQLISPNSHIAIALSGGADSMALTLLAQDWVAQHGGTITALTVDHGLREASAAEASQVAEWMRARGIEHHILTPAHTDASNNLQEAARGWRYEALAEFCRARGILHCLVAQHAGDNRETVEHNIARGETADGASGMRRVRNFRGVRFVRPMLALEHAEIEAFLRERDVVWVNDPSNADTHFARVRARKMLEQDTVRTRELDGLIVQHAASRALRDDALAEAAMRCVMMSPLGFADMSLTAWRQLKPLVASQLLADCITSIGGSVNRPRGRETARLVAALDHAFTTRTLQHCEITLEGDCLRFARERARVAPALPLRGCGAVIWDRRFSVQYDLPEAEGYTLGAIGRKAAKQLALPAATPGLWHLDELVFVPHIGMPQSASARVSIGFVPPKPLAAAPFW